MVFNFQGIYKYVCINITKQQVDENPSPFGPWPRQSWVPHAIYSRKTMTESDRKGWFTKIRVPKFARKTCCAYLGSFLENALHQFYSILLQHLFLASILPPPPSSTFAPWNPAGKLPHLRDKYSQGHFSRVEAQFRAFQIGEDWSFHWKIFSQWFNGNLPWWKVKDVALNKSKLTVSNVTKKTHL